MTGSKFKDNRVHLGLAQQKCADAIGISRDQLRAIECASDKKVKRLIECRMNVMMYEFDLGICVYEMSGDQLVTIINDIV